MKLKENDLVKYQWIYSNEEPSVGVIVKIEKDLNFGRILHILGNDNCVECIPQRMITIKRLDNEHKNTHI
tara:strand:+ start:136 stop:345 length:210 start_codon:yes stop_codon:yes gene_type:complete